MVYIIIIGAEFYLRKLNNSLNIIFNKLKKQSIIISISYKYVIIGVLLLFFIGIIINFGLYSEITKFVSVFGSLITALISLYIANKGTRQKTGAEIIPLTDGKVVVEFMNYSKSNDFVRIKEIAICETYDSKDGVKHNLNECYLKKDIPNFFNRNWNKWNSLNAGSVIEIRIDNFQNKGNCYQPIQEMINRIKVNTSNMNANYYYLRVVFETHGLIDSETNISINTLVKNGSITLLSSKK